MLRCLRRINFTTRQTLCSVGLLCRYNHTFMEEHRKGKYKEIIERQMPLDVPVEIGFKYIWPELKLMKQEIATKLACDDFYSFEHNDYEYMWKFDDVATRDKWVVTSDSDLAVGYSTADMCVSKAGYLLFYGNLCTKPIKDGITQKTGFCNIRSPRNKISFQRYIPYDWSRYTHMLVKFRGDGRTYAINVLMDRYFDLTWADQYNYFLYSRGGPYWQIAKIPFSKFFLSHKGRIQDKQESVDLNKVRNLGFTCSDQKDGPFELELGYVGLIRDENHTEEFHYEMYTARPTEVGM